MFTEGYSFRERSFIALSLVLPEILVGPHRFISQKHQMANRVMISVNVIDSYLTDVINNRQLPNRCHK